MAQHVIELTCIADNYVDMEFPNSNYGTAIALKPRHKYLYQSHNYSAGAGLQFNVSSVPIRKKIISSSLKIYVTNIVGNDDRLNVLMNMRRTSTISHIDEYVDTYNNTSLLYIGGDIVYNAAALSLNTYNSIKNTSPLTLVGGENFLDCFVGVSGSGNGFDKYITFASRETANPPKLSITYEDVPPDKPTLLEPIGVFKDSASVIRFSWQYISDVGGEQKAFDLQWSTNQSDWTTASETTEDTYYDMPVDTLPTGNIYWRVRTYNEYDERSDYSETSTFYSIAAPNVPSIQSVTNECRPTINWSAFDQQVYQLQVLQEDIVIYDSGELPGINNRSYKIKDFLSDGQYTSKIRIKNEYDLWSNWGENTFTISTIKPDKPSLSIQRSQYGLELTITGAQETSYIYRDDVCIAATNEEKYFDNAVANEKEYQYFIRALSANGFADSDIVLGTASFRFGLLSTKNEVFELKVNLNAIPTKNITNTQPGTMNMYDGRKYPVSELSLNVEQTLTLQYYLKTYAEVEKIIEIADMKETVLYRDKRGRRIYGVITGLSIQDTMKGHNVSITISATDHDEAVEI